MKKMIILIILGNLVFVNGQFDQDQWKDIDWEIRREMEFDVSTTACTEIERKVNYEEYEEYYQYGECNEKDNDNVIDHIGFEVDRCCGSHGFMTKATCPGGLPQSKKKDILGVPVCLNHEPGVKREDIEVHPLQTDFCPKHCLPTEVDEVRKEMFIKEGNKTFFKSLTRKHPFCVDFHCPDGVEYSWKLKVIECICDSALEKNKNLVKKVPDKPLCCKPTEFLRVTEQDTLVCEQDENQDQELGDITEKDVLNPTCDWKHKKSFQLVDLSKSRLPDLNDVVCIGATQEKNSDLLSEKGVICGQICNGKGHPCIRKCCPDGEYKIKLITCSTTNKSLLYFSDRNLNTEYLPVVSPLQNQEKRILYPEDMCENRFEFNTEDSSITLVERGIKLEYGEFCLAEMDEKDGKGGLYLEALLKHENRPMHYTAQTSILFVSIGCLIITITVYTVLPPLRNAYSKIMLNFCISMLAAFLSLTVIKKPDWFTESHVLSYKSCKFVGYFNQYCFLSMFMWMTIMSYDIFKQIRELKHVFGKGDCSELFKQMLVGYGIPGLITIMAVIVDAADEGNLEKDCLPLRPRFGKSVCSFQNRGAKFFWLLLPILLMLFFNTFMFIYVILNICKSEALRTEVVSLKERRKEKMDKTLLYLKLFFGMGFVWYFEIIGFLAYAKDDEKESDFWWLPDTLNMLQGVWVFLTFVCKRNVLSVILLKRKQLYHSLRRSTGGQPIELREGARKKKNLMTSEGVTTMNQTTRISNVTTVSTARGSNELNN